jgi:Ca2+-binding RTX toxin-like protein
VGVARLGALVVLVALTLATPWIARSADPCARPTIRPPKNAETGVFLPGTNGDDVIVGTPFNDAIEGYYGDDIICGLGGDDTLSGDQDDDTIYGGGGRDGLWGSFGHDDLYGGAGNDTFHAGVNDGLEDDFCNGGKGTRDSNPDGDCDVSRLIER